MFGVWYGTKTLFKEPHYRKNTNMWISKPPLRWVPAESTRRGHVALQERSTKPRWVPAGLGRPHCACVLVPRAAPAHRDWLLLLWRVRLCKCRLIFVAQPHRGMANVRPPGPPWRTCACCPRTACSLWLTASAVLGSSLLAQVMRILALWVTDRQEHELIVGAHQHSCYHCDVPQHLKDQPSPSKLVDAADVCAQPSTSKLVDAADVL